MVVEVLKVDELPLVLKQLVVLGNVLHQDVVGQVDGSLNVAVVRPGHGSLDGLVGPCNQTLVPLNVVGNVSSGGRVPQGVLVENPEAFVDGLALLLDLGVDARQLLVQLMPVVQILRLSQSSCVWEGLSLVNSSADLQILLYLSFFQGVVFARAYVEHQLVPVKKIIHFISDNQNVLSVGSDLGANRVIGQSLFESVVI